MEEFVLTPDENLILVGALRALLDTNPAALTDALRESAQLLVLCSPYHENPEAVENLSGQFAERLVNRLQRHSDHAGESTEIFDALNKLNDEEFNYFEELNNRYPEGANEAQKRGEPDTRLRKLWAAYQASASYFNSLTA